MKKYQEWGTCLVNNLWYERPANLYEQRRQVPQSVKTLPVTDPKDPNCGRRGPFDMRKTWNKYWRGECIECGDIHIVRSDKIVGKRCRHNGTKHR